MGCADMACGRAQMRTKTGDKEADEKDDSGADGLVDGIAAVRVELHCEQDGHDDLRHYHLNTPL